MRRQDDYKIDVTTDIKGVEIWKDSDGDIWYDPNKINFSKPAIKNFILPNLIELEKGYYPLPPRETGYTDSDLKAYRTKTSAYYEFAVGIAAEVTLRISQVPRGRILIDKYTYHVSDEELSKRYRVLNSDLYEFIACRLAYISGNRRKKTDFKTWCRTSWKRWNLWGDRSKSVANENSPHV